MNEINEAFAWAHIELMEWSADFDIKRIKRYCLNELDKETITIVRRHVAICMDELDRSCPDVYGVSDDSWSDARAHVIGLGKEAYENTLTDQCFIQNIIDEKRYVESFLYSLPYDDDWTFFERAPKRANEILAALEDVDTPPEAAGAMIFRDVVRRLKSIANKDFKEAANDWDKSLYRMWDGSMPMSYAAPNLINDAANYLPK